ncbi:aminodeoxychorismate lyase [Bacillus spongiae]|uniref:Aminodeoxychorismate lyase n=1 Tax=Bacillus spongiae TaxID=2683610 RepID=A0ABU8HJD9_9BACI
MYLYMNGMYVKKEEAVISPFDHGFLYGMGLFETFRTYNGHPFLLDDHIERLHRGFQELNISHSIKKETILSILNELQVRNQLRDAYVRLNVSAGVGDIGLRSSAYDNPTIIVFQKEPPSLPSSEKEGKILNLKRNTPETRFRLKSHHYFNNMAAKRELGVSPDGEGIFLTEHRYVAEGITSNIFWYKGGKLYTPSVETGILNGITRQFILSISSRLEINVEEGLYSVDELLKADEIFVTNSIQEIVPLNKLCDEKFPGRKGKVFQLLSNYYKKKTEKLWSRHEIGGKI